MYDKKLILWQNKKNPTRGWTSFLMERVTGLEPATVCLEGRNSSQLSYTRIFIVTIYVYIFLFSFQENFNLGVAGFEPATFRFFTLK